MFASLEDLTYDAEVDGTLARKQLDKVILSRGAWATVLFLYQEWDEKRGAYRAPKVAVVRFQKARGTYRKHASFTLNHQDQARELLDVLSRWSPSMAATSDDDEGQSRPGTEDDVDG